MEQQRHSSVKVFNGGMNNVLFSNMIASNEAQYLQNNDLQKGLLFGKKEPINYLHINKPYIFQFSDILFRYSAYRSNVLFDNKYYWADKANTRKVLPNGEEINLGIKAPIRQLKVKQKGIGNHKGKLRYTYTFYDNRHGIESSPAPLSEEINAEGVNIHLSHFQLPPTDNITHYRVYRIGGYLTQFSLIKELPITEHSMIDNYDDAHIDGRELLTLRSGVPPYGLENLIEYGGRLYGSVGSKLYYSAIGMPDNWYIFDFIPFSDIIVGIAKTQSGLIVIGDNWATALIGSDPTNFKLRTLSNSIGCVGKESIGLIKGDAIWLSNKGIVISNGYDIKLLTNDRVYINSSLSPLDSLIVNEKYYLILGEPFKPNHDLYPNDYLFPNTMPYTNTSIMEIDFTKGRGYALQYIELENTKTYRSLSNINGFVSIISQGIDSDFDKFRVSSFIDTDTIYVETLFTPEDDLYPSNTLYPKNVLSFEYKDNFSLLEGVYLSPAFDEGFPTILKEYEKVRIQYKGDIKVFIWITNTYPEKPYNFREMGEPIISDKASSYDKEDTLEIGIPNNYDKGYSICFGIIFKGYVKGIEWNYQIRNNN